jgi:2-iminoacetate synthase
MQQNLMENGVNTMSEKMKTQEAVNNTPNFIDPEYIETILSEAKKVTKEEIEDILTRAKTMKGLKHHDIAVLLQSEDEAVHREIYQIAGQIKKAIYGNRIVVFAPLYVSDYCVNDCTYCGYRYSHKFRRRQLSQEEIRQEVGILESMGHKRLALEAGEDPENCTIDYILECLDTIYKTPVQTGSAKGKPGAIRRVNVNIAATTIENYTKLKDVGIGTYILFQETYHKPSYLTLHPKGPKHNFEYHLTAFDRAMQGGVEDVGAGALFGLYDPLFEVLGLMIHNEHLEEAFGVGFHTISVPRIKKADGVNLSDYPHLVPDNLFKRIVAILRLAVPFTGIILSTRETAEMRSELIGYGVSQVSAGSATGVGGYKASLEGNSVHQFITADERAPLDVLKSLIDEGNIPSYCTACYRMGRTGDRFMQLAKSGQIHNVCTPNALMTLMEYACDYGDSELAADAEALIEREVPKIVRDDIRALTVKNLSRIKAGERDLFL